MNRYGLFLSLVAIIGTARAESADSDPIYDYSFKYQVSLQIGNKHICGGGIIGDEYVLTAAHCLIDDASNGFKDGPISIVAGTVDLGAKGRLAVDRSAKQIYVPKEYKAKSGDVSRRIADIAVIKLNEPLGLDSNVKLSKLELPSDKDETHENRLSVIAGYGFIEKTITEDGKVEKQTTSYLNYIRATILDCAKFYSDPIDKETRMCAQSEQRNPAINAGICDGDDGGPLVIGNKVIGVASEYDVTCNERVYPAIYTRVAGYIEFINDALNGKEPQDARSVTY